MLGLDEKEINQRYKESSPIHLLPFHTPQVLLFGAEDKVIPRAMNKNYEKIAKKKGDQNQLITIPYAAHHEYNVPNSVVWPELVKQINALSNDW